MVQLLNSTSTILLDLHSEPDTPTSPQPDTHTSRLIIHDMDQPLSTTTLTVEPFPPPTAVDNRSEEPTTTSQPPKKRQRRTTSRGDIEQFHTDYAQVLFIFTGTGSRTNAIKDARIFKSTFYLNKAIIITELHIVKPEAFQQEVRSAITNNLQLSEFSLRCKEVLVSYKDELKALKKAEKIF